MTMNIHDTRTRKKQAFEPIDRKNIGLYVCGATVYDRIHVGNARSLVVFDLLARLLKHKYGDSHVRYVRNITDIDDKIVQRVLDENFIYFDDFIALRLEDFWQDCKALNLLRPDVSPRATENVRQMIDMIKTLIRKGHAYEVNGDVYFDVSTFNGYGILSGRNAKARKAGARIQENAQKRNPDDFVLWKKADNVIAWQSPWGLGRPGWHIECSAMSNRYLGDIFDIHGGGQDLIFPHHENEIAQSCCAHNADMMAKYWVHNGYVTSDGAKMSKSAGNFVSVHDALKAHDGLVIRFALLSKHYRKPLDWSDKMVEQAGAVLASLYASGETRPDDSDEMGYYGGDPDDDFLAALYDDMNTPKAIARLHGIAKMAKNDRKAYLMLVRSLIFMGIRQNPFYGEDCHV